MKANKLDEVIQEIYADLKDESDTYGELRQKIAGYCREHMFENVEKGTFLMSQLSRMLDKDVDSVSVTLPIK